MLLGKQTHLREGQAHSEGITNEDLKHIPTRLLVTFLDWGGGSAVVFYCFSWSLRILHWSTTVTSGVAAKCTAGLTWMPFVNIKCDRRDINKENVFIWKVKLALLTTVRNSNRFLLFWWETKTSIVYCFWLSCQTFESYSLSIFYYPCAMRISCAVMSVPSLYRIILRKTLVKYAPPWCTTSLVSLAFGYHHRLVCRNYISSGQCSLTDFSSFAPKLQWINISLHNQFSRRLLSMPC